MIKKYIIPIILAIVIILLVVKGTENGTIKKVEDIISKAYEGIKNDNPIKELGKDNETKKEVIEPPKKEDINEECIKRVKKIVGDSFIIEYLGTLTDISKRIEFISSIFPENNEHFNSKSGYFSGYAISSSGTTKRKTIRKIRLCLS